MAAELRLRDAAGETLGVDDGALDFGTVTSGATSEPRRLVVRNEGDAEVYFARARAIPHPTGQVGATADTAAATGFALRSDGAFEAELELGTLAPGEERAFWVRWVVPGEAPAGAVVWAVEVIGSIT